MKRFVLAISAMALFFGAEAQTLAAPAANDAAQSQPWSESYQNAPLNLRYFSNNPTRLSYNPLRNYAVAKADYTWRGGHFHDVDQSGDVGDLNVFIGGLRQVGRLSLAGHIQYQNLKEDDHRWNSALWLHPDNPFALGDSVNSDVTTEAFNLHAAAAYEFSPRWKGGLEINMDLGTLSDSDDPRPKTHSSNIPITAGAEYLLTKKWTLGLTAGLTLYHSTINYTVVNPLNNYRFFIFNGMGDYYKMSGESGYDRNYKGTTWRGGLQATWQGHNIANHAEVFFSTGNQDAKDGESSYTFKGGDFRSTALSFQDRLMLTRGRLLHNVRLQATTSTGKGNWYEQRRAVDTEHANRVYYQVLNKYKIQDYTRLGAALAYRLDAFHADSTRNLFVEGKADFSYLTRKHYIDYEGQKQELSYLDLSASVGKELKIKNVALLGKVGAMYRLPLTTTFNTGCSYVGRDGDISYVYAARQFEYSAASRLGLNFLVDANMPVSKNLTAGAFVNGDFSFYTDNEDTWEGYKSTSYSQVCVGLYLRF